MSAMPTANKIPGWWLALAAFLLEGCAQEGAGQTSTGSAFLAQGIEQLDKGDLDGSVRLFSLAIQDSPADPEGYYWRGMAYLRRQDATRAEKDFEDAVRVSPGHAKGWFQLGYVRLNYLANVQGALAAFREAISLDGGMADAYLWRGLAYRELAYYKPAVEDFRRAVELGPSTEEWKQRADHELRVTEQLMAGSRPRKP